MAQNFTQKILPYLLLSMVMAMAICLVEATDLKVTKLSLYLQDNSAFGSPIATVVPVAGIAGKEWNISQFGTLFVTDDNATETPDPKSPQVGHVQGMYVTAGLDGLNSQVMVSIVFTNKQFNGSSLQIQGISKQFEPVRELSVVSGTGKFRFGRGYATFETYSLDRTRQYSVIRCNVTVEHC